MWHECKVKNPSLIFLLVLIDIELRVLVLHEIHHVLSVKPCWIDALSSELTYSFSVKTKPCFLSHRDQDQEQKKDVTRRRIQRVKALGIWSAAMDTEVPSLQQYLLLGAFYSSAAAVNRDFQSCGICKAVRKTWSVLLLWLCYTAHSRWFCPLRDPCLTELVKTILLSSIDRVYHRFQHMKQPAVRAPVALLWCALAGLEHAISLILLWAQNATPQLWLWRW